MAWGKIVVNTTFETFNNKKCYRLIPSKYPPIALYEDVADASMYESIFAIESLTNPRLTEEVGDFTLVPVDERLAGIPHCSYVMAAFTHISPEGSRFCTGDFGAYYAAEERITAIKETVYHLEEVMSYTNEPKQDVHMRELVAYFSAKLVDIQHLVDSPLYDPSSYADSQAFATTIKQRNNDGIVYSSVRNSGAACYALFKPNLVSKISPSAHFAYQWDGEKVANVYELKQIAL
jgi:hypothetical protein